MFLFCCGLQGAKDARDARGQSHLVKLSQEISILKIFTFTIMLFILVTQRVSNLELVDQRSHLDVPSFDGGELQLNVLQLQSEFSVVQTSFQDRLLHSRRQIPTKI